MDHQKEHRNYKFRKLTPDESADIQGYEQSLDFVFDEKNNDIKNIAITGNFGSGKSSVIRSYAERRKGLSFIYVSLAHFEGVSGEAAKDNYDVDIEKKIINHIVQQLPEKHVSESGFRIKKKFSVVNGIWLALRIAFLICAVFYMNSWNTMNEFQDVKIWSFLTSTSTTALILCGCFVDLISLVFSGLKSLNAGRKIKTLRLQNGTVEFSDQNEKSYFDQHLDEILYLLAGAKNDAIVFEDIDRFKEIDLKVLEHLRELCTLANDRIHNTDSKRSKRKRNTIRFIYLIGDHVFKEYTDRTKFFDYIIPVIPVVDASNSYAKMREYLEESGDYEQIDDRFLRGLCLYLDDLRIVKNIVNEFQIYSAKLAGTAKDANQLLALILYKNIYPDDFSELQRENGYLFNVFSTKDEVTKSNIEAINKEIEELRNELTIIENEMLVSVEELDVVNRERMSSPNRFKDGISISDWQKRVFGERKQIISSKYDNQSQTIRAAIIEKQRQLTHIRSLHLSNLISDDNEAIVFGYNNAESSRKKRDNQLVEFLIKNGHIDETTYRDYVALFYEKGMSYRDKDYLISVNSHNGKPFDYELQDVELVIENLGSDDFIEPEIRNYSIVDYILAHNKKEYVQKFVFQLQESIDYEFLSLYLRVSKHRVSFIKALNMYWPESMVTLTSNQNQFMTLGEIQDYLICSLAHIGADELMIQNKENALTIYIQANFVKAECNDTDFDAVGDSLVTLGVKFMDLNQQIGSDGLRTAVYTRDSYELNRTNVESLLTTEYGLSNEDIKGKELTAVFSDSEQALLKYVDANINVFLADIVMDNAIIQDTLEVVVDILNRGDVDDVLKKQYISRLSEPLNSLEKIDEKQWSMILTQEKVFCNSAEVLRYFWKFGLTAELVQFINNCAVNIDYTTHKDDDLLGKFFDKCLRSGDLDDDRYRDVMHQIGRALEAFNVPGLRDEKVRILIEENLIPMNPQNLQFIRRNYPNAINLFAASDMDGYLRLAQRNNFIVSEAMQLLEECGIDLDSRQKIADRIPNAISVQGWNYDEGIIMHILSTKFDANDIQYLIEHYEDYSGDLQDVIYKKLKDSSTMIKNNISAIKSAKKLLYRIFEDNDISVVDKCNLLEMMIIEKSEVDMELFLHKIGFSNLIKLVSGDTSRLPQIKNGNDEKAILNLLKKHSYIEDYSVDENTDTIRVNRKKPTAAVSHDGDNNKSDR